jgi:hypothetical protein
MTTTTINGNAYSDDGTAARDMRNGGHKLWLLPLVADVATVAAAADADATAAAASAAAAASSAANLVGTSSSSVAIGTGSKSFTASTGRQWGVGQYLIVVDSANSANTMTGQITAYNSGTGALTLNVTAITGSGTKTSWNIYVSGVVGATGGTGATGASGNSLPRLAVTGTATVGATDNGKLVDCSGTFTVTFAAPGTLGANWQTIVRNAGTGDVTVAHTSGNIDGLTSFVLYPGAARIFQCDGTTLRSVPIVAGQRTYTASGSYVVPPGVAALLVRAVGAGASGGRGARQGTGVAADGGPGGGGGETLERRLLSIAAGTSITVTVPSGPAGAAGATSDTTAATTGTDGGNASFGTYVEAIGGKVSATGGSPLSTINTGADPGGLNTDTGSGSVYWMAGRLFQGRASAQGCPTEWAGGAGGNGRDGTSARAARRSLMGGGGGGGGGSISTANVGLDGGAGGGSGQSAGAVTTFTGLGGAGGVAPAAGTAGTLLVDSPAGCGGGGGGAGVAAAAGAGGNGAVPGGGGGGGGASRNGFASGAGGSGGRGEVVVTEVI